MAACGATKEEVAAMPAMADADVKVLEKLAKLDWGKAEDFKGAGVSGKIYKASLDGFSGVWVKSDKVYEKVTRADYRNYMKFMAETSSKDKTVAKAENKAYAKDGTVSELYTQFKMGMMISNRDLHVSITQCKKPDSVNVDDMKCDDLTVWKDMEKQCDVPKKVVRMKVLSFSLGCDTDAGYKAIDFDNYDFGGSLPTKITNKFVGNKDDFITMAKDINDIKKNGGKYKK